ncbi:acid phosphatase type 7-like [Limulus polyphemus]|uniref:Purple acid phosphatase n=1 Tax=Limulus polyphemus TaxID=6850 RepID=A0ABM1B1B4_LIMPO|nr:acid phosphatase type 7-like [Limulus polyphemus]
MTGMAILTYLVFLGVSLCFLSRDTKCEAQTQPEQIHISYGADPTQMIVTWVTMNPTNTSMVEYGKIKLTQVAKGNSILFTDGGPQMRQLYIHRVILDKLKPGKTYRYHCGSADGWSAVYWFTAMKEGTNWSPRFAVFGDLGNVNAQSLPRLQREVQQGMYDVVLHVGDFAYNLDSNDAKVGDQFMRQVEPIAAYVPYMTCVGNHEQAYNFSNYVNRFSMVEKTGKLNNHFYSFDIGPAHIIAFSTEFYYFVQYGWKQIVEQYKWLEKELKEANKPWNRAARPWIITMGHRPMYCSTDDGDDCTHKESIIRKGIPVIRAFGLEDLFYKYGVDLELWAHEHVYERLWPVYDRKVYNGSYQYPYTNPKAPVHIITGSAGCHEYHDPFVANPAEWSALRNSDYGYTRMTIINGTHLYLEQVSDDKDGEVIDWMTLIKEKHGPEAWK